MINYNFICILNEQFPIMFTEFSYSSLNIKNHEMASSDVHRTSEESPLISMLREGKLTISYTFRRLQQFFVQAHVEQHP